MDIVSFPLHLDWHVQMKRRERDMAKKGQVWTEPRPWYLQVPDWLDSEDIEEERMNEDDMGGRGTPDDNTVPASAVPEENVCPVCGEEFERFFRQEEEFNGREEAAGGGQWFLR